MPTVYPTLSNSRQIEPFEERSVLYDTARFAAFGVMFGSCILMTRQMLSPARTVKASFAGRFRKVAIYGGAGGLYGVGESLTSNIREKNDAINVAVGATLAGALVGGLSRGSTVSRSLGLAAAMGTTAAIVDWGTRRNKEDSIKGADTEVQVLDESHPRQGLWDLVYRRPLSQTVEEMGDLAKQFVRD